MKLLKSSILLKLAECSWRDRWEAIQEKHNERNQNQPRLDHLCIAKLKTFLDKNQTKGTWECDDLYQPSTEYQCVNRCHADGKVSGLVKVMCRFAGPVLRVGGYVDCPSIISDEEARFITSRRDKCEDNLITITNGSLKFLKTRGATTEYNIFCDGKGKSKIRAKCDEVKPNGHPKKWKFTKGSNAQKACPGGGSTGGGKKKPNHCKDVAFLNANRPLGAGQWNCDGTTKASVCRAVCSDENLTADVRIRCFKTNISYLKGDENVRCEPAEEVVFSPLSPMPLLRNCNGIRESTSSSKMPWVTELTIDSDRKCRATAINDKWLITAATCCLNAESVTMPSGAAASDVHVNGFYGDIADGTMRNFDFCLVRFDDHGLAVPCRKSFYTIIEN